MLKTNQQSISLGTQKIGVPTRFSYKISNPDGPFITITRLHAGCGRCTEASIESAHLNKGEETKLHATFTPNSTGEQMKSITIFYKEEGISEEKSLKLSFTANVI